eukprot:14733172-Heterocapsa_arctica.AAC.1
MVMARGLPHSPVPPETLMFDFDVDLRSRSNNNTLLLVLLGTTCTLCFASATRLREPTVATAASIYSVAT